jgi:hypothetical protein
MARISIDILFCDRLNLLQDDNAEAHLNWLPEVSLFAEILNIGLSYREELIGCWRTMSTRHPTPVHQSSSIGLGKARRLSISRFRAPLNISKVSLLRPVSGPWSRLYSTLRSMTSRSLICAFLAVA